jgi:uncharacterized protein
MEARLERIRRRSHSPPRVRGGVGFRSICLVSGLFLFAVGIVLLFEARLGLSPWDVLNQGVAKHSPLSFGTANIAIALVLLVVARRLRARIGPGTLANAILIGLFVDLLLRIAALDRLSQASLSIRALFLVVGIVAIGLGSALYIGAAFGAGPRDSVMLGLSQISGVRIGIVRTALETSVTVGGFLLGGTVGVGTLAFAISIGPALELSFYLLVRSPLGELNNELPQKTTVTTLPPAERRSLDRRRAPLWRPGRPYAHGSRQTCRVRPNRSC